MFQAAFHPHLNSRLINNIKYLLHWCFKKTSGFSETLMSLDYFLPFSLRIRNLGITSQIQNQKPNTKSEPEMGSYTPKQGSGEQPGSVACKDALVMRGLWCCVAWCPSPSCWTNPLPFLSVSFLIC